jgi:TetR/AcrR family transcriptional repressor of mexJK operon
MKQEGQVKQDHIINAAIKRFSHFGIGKTTLAEIADDLAISKPSLFYYFKDKNGLVAEVAKKIISEFLAGFEADLETTQTTEERLQNLVEMKRKYFKKYFLLAVQGESVEYSKLPPEITIVYRHARNKSVLLISKLFQQGIETGELKPMDTVKTASIILDIFSALEHCMKAGKSIPDVKEFDNLFDREKELVSMIVNGLKK